jgi:uncharacterized protein YndB with AHSA1/START domain
MNPTATTSRPSDTELLLTRVIDAPREKLYRAWTDPEIMKQFFVPRPWTTPKIEIDVRPGGGSLVVMADPEGNEYPNAGMYLEVVENERLVFTDAYTAGFIPSGKAFFTCHIMFEDESGKTRYTARALHWTKDDCDSHEKMGFHEGWSQVADQLEEVVARL